MSYFYSNLHHYHCQRHRALLYFIPFHFLTPVDSSPHTPPAFFTTEESKERKKESHLNNVGKTYIYIKKSKSPSVWSDSVYFFFYFIWSATVEREYWQYRFFNFLRGFELTTFVFTYLKKNKSLDHPGRLRYFYWLILLNWTPLFLIFFILFFFLARVLFF